MDYERIYNRLIDSFKGFEKEDFSEYVERHHILPTSLGGTDEPSNLVHLPHRHHYIAHRLLSRFGDKNQRIRMMHSLSWFAPSFSYKEKRSKTHTDDARAKMKATWSKEEVKEKQRKPKSIETRMKMSAAQLIAANARDNVSIGAKGSIARMGKPKNKTIYSFYHPNYGERKYLQMDLRNEFGLKNTGVSLLCSGKIKDLQGWTLT
jgi:hypothetical protein